MSEEEWEIYRRIGVGPFILGKLKRAALEVEIARELLAKTPPWNIWRRRYLKDVIRQGELARKHLDEYLRRMREVRRQLQQEKLQRTREDRGGVVER